MHFVVERRGRIKRVVHEGRIVAEGTTRERIDEQPVRGHEAGGRGELDHGKQEEEEEEREVVVVMVMWGRMGHDASVVVVPSSGVDDG